MSRLIGILALAAGLGLAVAIPLSPDIPVPFGFTFLIVAALMVASAFIGRHHSWTSSVFMVAFALSISLAITEFFFAWQVSREQAASPGLKDGGSFTDGYFNAADPDLGYSPYANKSVDHIRTAGDKTVFHAAYKIGPGAFRVTPGNAQAAETDVFFGDSFTFGEGLNDDQTLPAAYSKARGYQTNVINLGFHGYGPHQMLRALETGRFDKYLTGEVKHVFYQTIGYHTERVTGLAPWDVNGPRYVLDSKRGAPVFTGRYSDFPSRIFDQSHPVLYRSYIVKILASVFDVASRKDIDLIVGIFVESARIVRERFHADFTLLVWDFDPHHDDPTGAKIADAAEKKGLHVVRISKLLTEHHADFAKHYLIPIDGHPNAQADAILGEALAKLEH